ncbi:MAG: thiamine diphosphokinase [Anaeromicrobium sp.]|jgi:thiamine pyrophosphokinase|uniref:thiamine diphosphokinase n=1 Tax=Anaeromicrobium sp. TaxID=1929132 RepID=UPI0025FB9F0A|nr:thiamine diphosphokinase [Anaeromicrobium sp.]MCT4594894.1 thiamine diphosphokinase [Anaeromicrobium sp.]
MRFLIIANGTIDDLNFLKDLMDESDFVICADGGARYLSKIFKIPNVIVGDLDSIDEKSRIEFEKKGVKFFKFPPKKDFTDMELAISYALNKGAKEMIITGGIGTRMDHTIANVTLLLPLAKKGIKAKIVNEKNEIMVVLNREVINCDKNKNISLIPLTKKVEGITLKGFEYPLYKEDILMGSSRGVSNKLKDSSGIITIEKGHLLLTISED